MNFKTIYVVPLIFLGACSTGSSAPNDVAISTSSTAVLIDVPSLVSLSRDQASEILLSLGLVPKFEPVESNKELDTVVSHSPGSKASVATGSVVLLRYAIKLTNDFKVFYEVRDKLWTELANNECEYRDENIRIGQSFRLIGPDKIDLAAFPVTVNGKITESVDLDKPGTVCQWILLFKDVPEVATYTLVDPSYNSFPAAPLGDIQGNNWEWLWYWSKNA